MGSQWVRSFFYAASFCTAISLLFSANVSASDTTQRTIAFQHAKTVQSVKSSVKSGPVSVKKAASQTTSEKMADTRFSLKVGLFSGQDTVQVSAKRAFLVRDAVSKAVLEHVPAGTVLNVRQQSGKFQLGGKAIQASSLELAAEERESSLFVVHGKSYRGSLLLQMHSAGITVINEVSLEAYLYGVIPKEMPAEWPAEALKAQAVAARTFALYQRGRHHTEGYDVCATTHCQVYGGTAAERSETNAAVDATRGEVLYAAGKPIDAFFHTDSGGMTENSENVWGTYYPYLRAARESVSKTNPWQVKYTVPELQVKLKEAGYDIGILKKIQLTPLVIGQAAADRSTSGRVQLVKFFGTQGIASLTGNELRSALSLKSTLFDIRLERLDVQNIDVSVGMKGKKIAVNLPAEEETNGLQYKLHVLSGKEGENIVLFGYGWGHGLGLSQWGARRMAAEADYQKILAHYYQNTTLKKLY